MVVRFELKIPSLGINVWHHLAGLIMPNSYPRDKIFNLNLTTMLLCFVLGDSDYMPTTPLKNLSARR